MAEGCSLDVFDSLQADTDPRLLHLKHFNFSRNSQNLGAKESLERQVCGITGIPIKALYRLLYTAKAPFNSYMMRQLSIRTPALIS
jgi:hypothetical protein